MTPHQLLIERWENAPLQVTLGLGREATLDEAIETFEIFLKAVGYSLPENTHLDIVHNDDAGLKDENERLKKAIEAL